MRALLQPAVRRPPSEESAIDVKLSAPRTVIALVLFNLNALRAPPIPGPFPSAALRSRCTNSRPRPRISLPYFHRPVSSATTMLKTRQQNNTLLPPILFSVARVYTTSFTKSVTRIVSPCNGTVKNVSLKL